MLAREAVLNNAKVVKLLRDKFVCFAFDNCDTPNATAADWEWLKDKGAKASTQGMSVFTAGGKMLGGGGDYRPEVVMRMLEQALAKFQPEDTVTIKKDKESVLRPPEGGLVLYVTWKVLEPEKLISAETHPETRQFLNSLGADRLWVRKDEAEALAKGAFPHSLRRRMAGHLGRVLPGGLKAGEIELLSDGKLKGALTSKNGDRAQALGFMETRDGKVTRFDLIVKGVASHWDDHGFSAGLNALPKDRKVPVALGFMLADPADDLSRTLPHGAKDKSYLK